VAATAHGAVDAELAASYDERGMFACVYCDGPYEHDDHIMPLALGGEHSTANLVPAGAECNMSKGAADPYQWIPRRIAELRHA
jgi:5-methylcytosine-specific restriction endonuclease McrA